MTSSTSSSEQNSETGVLGQTSLLRRLAKDDLLALSTSATLESYSEDATIFSQGDAGDSFYVIVSGSVRIQHNIPSGGQSTLALLNAGDCFGELSVFDGQPRSATAIASAPTMLLKVSRNDLLAWLAERPQAALILLETLSLRLRDTNVSLVEIAFSDIEHRLARILLELAAQHNRGGRTRPVMIKITQAELAGLLSVTRESVNKHLKLFVQRGWIQVSRGSVTVIDHEALANLDDAPEHAQ